MAQPVLSSSIATPEPQVTLQVGKCCYCKEHFDPQKGAKCLVDKKGVPVCHHKFCVSLTCRKALEERKSGMLSSGKGCPECMEKAGKSEFKSFVQLGSVVMPTDKAEDFFKSINLSGTGSITDEEVAGFICSYFDVDHAAAMDMVTKKWQSWDTTQRGLLRRGFGIFNATDGKLDQKEFEAARAYLSDLVKNARTPLGSAATLDAGASNATGIRRPAEDDDSRNVRQRTHELQNSMQSDLLLKLLRDDEAGWFAKFDKDKSGTISKSELIDALAATLAGKLSKSAARSIIEGLWDCIDTNNSEEVDMGEFKNFREILLKNVES
jgi:hypothetical protein